jgi:hypothetical protein
MPERQTLESRSDKGARAAIGRRSQGSTNARSTFMSESP